MKIINTLLLIVCMLSATQWQQPSLIQPGDLLIMSPSFRSDNMRIYASIYDPYYHADICYYNWNGSQWVYIDKVPGNVNTTNNEEEPFITYDGQHLYFQRSPLSTPYYLYEADWDGSGFVNTTILNPQINSNDCRYPSVTQDGLKLYFSRATGNGRKIFEATWSGSDWTNPTMLPVEVNGNDSFNKDWVTISPDGNEIYFTGAGSYPYSKLAFSQKIGGVWQQWQYCDENINLPGCTISTNALTYGSYEIQELYFARTNSPGTLTWHALRSPVSVEPASIGQIKANYR